VTSRYTLHTLAKGLQVLETLEHAEHGLTLTELARRQRQSQTVAFRLLKTLEDHGYVQQDAVTKRYTLGLRLWEIGARVAGRTGLVDAARPALKWLDDVSAVAAPVFDARGDCVASLSIAGPCTRFDHALEEFSRRVRKAGDEVSLKLGHRPRL
jgi:DNA-binding IclR family transcriptional regulator